MQDRAQHDVPQAFQAGAAEKLIGKIKVERAVQLPKNGHKVPPVHARKAVSKLLGVLIFHGGYHLCS